MKTAFSILLTALAFVPGALAQNWQWTTLSNTPLQQWTSVSCSADGRVIMGTTAASVVFSSTNYGSNWTSNTLTSDNWFGGTVSSDGSTMNVAATLNHAYHSTNAGLTWSPNAPSDTYLEALCCGSNGNILSYFGSFDHISYNGGSSYADQVYVTSSGVGAAACSVDGSKVCATGANGGIYRSVNFGTNFTLTSAPSLEWVSVASSADGTKLIAAAWESPLYLSTNSGQTWFNPVNSPTGGWQTVAMDPNGYHMAAMDRYSDIVWMSIDSGATWQKASLPGGPTTWYTGAFTADGETFYLGSYAHYWLVKGQFTPSLSVARSATNAVLTWQYPSTGFGLQQSTNLTQNHWTTVTNAPANVSNVNQVILPRTNQVTFFRLVN